mgnify:CR=1 FL=1
MKQSEALRLADALEHDAATQKIYHRPLVDASASELRRLHSTCEELGEMVERLTEGALATAQRTKELEANNAELLAALKFVIRGVPDTWEGVQQARAAIKKAEEVK